MRAFVVAVVAVLLVASPACASFPGRDGRIGIFAQASCGRYAEPGDPCAAVSFAAALAVSPIGREPIALSRCPGSRCAQIGPPRYSPDGRLVAAVDGSAVVVLRSDGTQLLRIDVPAASLTGVDWLRDGRIVADGYDERSGGVARTFVIGHDSVARAVTWRPKGERAWSARGGVAIAHPRGIYVRRRAAEPARLVLADGDRFTYTLPDWSPDGRRLAVVRRDAATGLQAIVAVATDGGDRRVVARAVTPACAFGDVAWAPSGARIAYSVGCYDSGAIYTVRIDGAARRTIFDLHSLVGDEPLEAYLSPAISWQPLR